MGCPALLPMVLRSLFRFLVCFDFSRVPFYREKEWNREYPRDEGDSGWLFRAFPIGGAWGGSVKNLGGPCILEPALPMSIVNFCKSLIFALLSPPASLAVTRALPHTLALQKSHGMMPSWTPG